MPPLTNRIFEEKEEDDELLWNINNDTERIIIPADTIHERERRGLLIVSSTSTSALSRHSVFGPMRDIVEAFISMAVLSFSVRW